MIDDWHASVNGPNTRKVFHKLLMSFRMQKETLRRLQRNQIFHQGSFLGGVVGGTAKRFGELCVPLNEILATPLKWSKRKISTSGTDGFLHHTSNYQFWNPTKSCISPANHFPFFLSKETVVHVRDIKFLKHHISSKCQRQLWLHKKLVLIYYWQINISYCHFS